MKALFIAITGTLVSLASLNAQNSTEYVLQEVGKNNTSLKAAKKQIEAEKIGNYTGIYLKNPEMEFGYLWGSPSSIGKRNDFRITQTFDFPSVYSQKNKIANLQNQQAEFEYQKQLRELLLQTRLICVDLIYVNALQNEYQKRILNAQKIADSYTTRLDKGDANILEYNKLQLSLLNIKKEAEANEIQRQSYLSELTALNGGFALAFDDSVFISKTIPVDFEQWYAVAQENSPVLLWLKKEIEISQAEVKLSSAMTLPKFSAGYMSEQVAGEQFQGISIGVTIPLWENKNTVKYNKSKTVALQSLESDNKILFYNQLKAQHTKAVALQKSVDEYKTLLKSYDNTALLNKALDKGEVSILEFLLEISMYYESLNKLLEAERDLNNTISVLNQYSN